MIYLFPVTRTQFDKNYGYTFLALSVSVIIINFRSSIRKYYQIGTTRTKDFYHPPLLLQQGDQNHLEENGKM